MSWNWCSSTVFQIRSSAAYGYSAPVYTAAADHHSSASRSRCSLRRLPAFVLACVVKVARWFSRYSSPDQTGASGYSANACSKNVAGVVISTRGEPSRSARRRARSSISRVGPPPPSPQPKGTRERVAEPLSWKLRTVCAISSPVNEALYVSTGGKWVKTRVPSMPSHQKVWCGNLLNWLQEIFCVRKYVERDRRTSCGIAAE